MCGPGNSPSLLSRHHFTCRECVCEWPRRGAPHSLLCVADACPRGQVCGTCCVPLALRTCSVGQRQYLGELAADVLVGTGSTALPPVPQKTPAPLSPCF